MNDTSNLTRRKNLAKLIIARDMIRDAHASVLLLDRMGHDPRTNMVAGGLEKALIVCYGSAFLEMRPFGKISDKWQKFANPKFNAMHDLLFELRKKSVAHGDYDRKKVWINRKAISDESAEALGKYQFSVQAFSLTKDSYTTIIGLCEDLEFRMHLEISDQLYKIYGDSSEGEKDFLLIDNDEL